MDLDSDGDIDILSGSYSRPGQDMAGLFQVLRGEKDGTFHAASALEGSDGQPLILPATKHGDEVIDRVCTRPFAADLDGDGKLDLVSGNFRGTFAFFRGEGAGKFAPLATWLEADGVRMEVPQHADPFLCDWDRDGDLDLLSGSGHGGAYLFENLGTKTKPRFAARTTLVAAKGEEATLDALGDAHLRGPASATRVWCDDVDGDGKLDLLVGDTVTLYHAAKDVEPSVASRKLSEWKEATGKLAQEQLDGEAHHARYEELEKARDAFVTVQRTGHVWLFRRR